MIGSQEQESSLGASRSGRSGLVVAPPLPVVALVGWLLPGAGYWLIGQRTRACTVGVAILALFILGVLIAGVRVVDAPNVLLGGNIVSLVLVKPAFIGQVMTGPIAIVATIASHLAAASPDYKNVVSHARIAEIGSLYTAIAGMLNLLAITDATYRAAKVSG